MAGNKNSGRKPRHLEERKLIGRHFKESVSTVVELMQGKDTPAHVRLDASRVLIDQHIGRPAQSQSIELEPGGVLGQALTDLLSKLRGYEKKE